jgi:hypothetical protein
MSYPDTPETIADKLRTHNPDEAIEKHFLNTTNHTIKSNKMAKFTMLVITLALAVVTATASGKLQLIIFRVLPIFNSLV